MATKLTDRHCTVHFYDLIITSHTAKGYSVNSPGCAPILDVVQAALTKAKGHELNPNAKVLMKSLDDVAVLTNPANGVALLMNCADMSKPDPRFKHFKNKTLRAAGKQVLEAVTKSCHAILMPDANNPCKALLVMTMRSGIQSEDVAELLNQLSELASKKSANQNLYEFADPSGAKDTNGKHLKYRVNYHFSALAHASETLDAALKTGTFKEMTLIEHEEFPFDQAGNLRVTQKTVKVEAVSVAPLSWSRIKQGIKSYTSNLPKGKFDKVKVSYATQKGEDKSTTMQINHLDGSFTRRDHIVLGINTPDCFPSIDNGIINDLQGLI
jgi:hypothetical protein